MTLLRTLSVAAVLLAASPTWTADDPDEARVLARLDRQPSPAAFDEAFAHFQDRGRADELEKRYRDRAAAGDGKAALVAGLFDLRAGRDAAAAAAFRKADAALPNDAVASRLLGQALARLGQRDEAVQAFERALGRNPARADMLAAAADLARLHSRAGRPDQARAAWERVEKRWPDRATREKVAQALVEEGQYADALARYESLAKDEPAAARRLGFRVLAADLYARMGKRAEALAAYEACLADVAPTDFRAADVRRRLEDLFLRAEDRTGLEAYYRDQSARRPDDLDIVSRLARLAADRGDAAEARRLLAAGLDRAPMNVPLRRQLVDLLERGGEDAAAAAECEKLDAAAPNDPDTLSRWGRLLLRTGKADAAAAVWRRLLPATDTPADAAAIGRVADLFRQAGRGDDALALYRRAVAAAPDDPAPREALGEYLVSAGKPDDALAAWRELAAGPRRTPANLARLSDLLADFNRPAEAAEAAREACDLKPDDFAYRLKLADRLAAANRPAEAAAAAAEAEKRAAGVAEAGRALDARLRALRQAGTLTAEADALRKQLTPMSPAGDWFRLARHEEEARRWPEATAALNTALARGDELSKAGLLVPTLVAAARVAELAGDLGAAADAARKLVEQEPRNRSDHLRRVARLETRRARPEPALAAARALVSDAPTDPERHRFLADTAFGLGQKDVGLDALRAAARVAPNDPDTLAALAATLADQFRPAEALEMAWRAFDKAPPERKAAQARKLAELAVRVNRFDRVPEEIERRLNPGDAAEARRTAALCVAQAYRAGGDIPAARRQLERLLPERPADTDLLVHLSELAEQEGDIPAALGYQRQLARVTGAAAEARLTSLLLRAGEIDEVLALWAKKGRAAKDAARQFEYLDNLLFFGRYADALTLASAAARERPADWELMYRKGVAEARLGRPEAAATFRGLLALHLPDNALSVLQPAEKPGREDEDNLVADRFYAAVKLRDSVGLGSRYTYRDDRATRDAKEFWTPADFGQGRMAALAWLSVLAEQAGTGDAFMAELLARRGPADAPDLRGLWDWWYMHTVLEDWKEMTACAELLRRTGLNQFDYICLNEFNPLLYHRDRLDDRVAGFRRLLARKPAWVTDRVFANLEKGLKRAGRGAEVEGLYRESLAAVPDRQAAYYRTLAAADRGDTAAVVALLPKHDVSVEWWGYTRGNIFPRLHDMLAVKAKAGAADEIAKVVGAVLDANHRRVLTARANPAPPARRAAAVGVQRYDLKGYRGEVRIDHPLPGPVLDAETLRLLGAAFLVCREAGLLDDLLDAVAARAAAAPREAAAAEHLAAFALRWWAGDRAAALKAGAAAPDDPVLRAEFARAAATAGKVKDGLAALDALTPADADGLRQREWAALALASQAGDVPRATLAAERLADLRLTAEEQIELAAEFATLGLTDKSRAVIDRVRAGAGGKVEVLLPAMRQLAAAGRAAEAAEAAFAVLRAVPPPTAPARDLRRDEALRTLNRLGRLTPLIARAEARRTAAPKAPAVLDELAEFYRAAGRPADELAAAEQAVLLRPEDAAARMALGDRYAEAGRSAEAAGHMGAAVRRQPRLFSTRSFAVTTAFTNARQLPKLVEVLQEADSRAFHTFDAGMIVQRLWLQPDQRAAAVGLLGRFWRPGRADNSGLEMFFRMSFNPRDDRWAYPGVFDLAKARLITDPVPPTADPWDGIGPLAAGFLAAAAKTGKLPAVLNDLSAAVARRPGWTAGRAFLAMGLARAGRPADARRELEAALRGVDLEALPEPAARVLTEEFAADALFAELIGPLLDARVRVLAAEDKVEFVDTRLLDGYVRTVAAGGRSAEAVRVLVALAEKSPEQFDPYRSPPRSSGVTYYPSDGPRSEIAGRLLGLGAPADAAAVAFPDWKAKDASDSRSSFGADPRDTYLTALDMLRSDTSAAAALAVLTADPPPRFELAAVSPEDGQLRLRGPAADVVAQAVNPAAADAVARRLGELRDARPDDVTVRALLALVRAAQGDAREAEALAAWVAAHPLDPLEGRPRAKHRRQASDHLTVWLPAAVCLKTPATRATGEALAARALAAADRLADTRAAQAILQEWLEIDKGNKAFAEARWSALFDRLVPASARPVPLSADAFARVMPLALKAAEEGFPAVSMRAARAALAGGLPVSAVTSTAGPTGFQPNTETRDWLRQLEDAWRKEGVPAAELYAVYADIVLPPAEPGRILEGTAIVGASGETMGLTAVALAREAGRTDDLKARTIVRLKYPQAVASARVLLARLASVTGDTALAREQLEWGKKQAEGKALAVSAGWNLVLPYLRHAELGGLARGVLARVAEDQRSRSTASINDRLTLEMARSYLRAKDVATARKYLAEYVSPTDARSAATKTARAAKAITAAIEWADAGHPAEAWAAAGLAADLRADDETATRTTPAPPSSGPDYRNLFRRLAADLAARQPADRYAHLKGWVLPPAGKPRFLAAAFDLDATRDPEFSSFLDDTSEAARDAGRYPLPAGFGGPRLTGLVDTFSWLVDAAAAANQLDDLAATVAPLADKKVDLTGHLLLLVLLRAEKYPAAAEAAVKRAADRAVTDQSEAGRTLNAVVARQALSAGPSRGWGVQLAALVGLRDRDPTQPSFTRSSPLTVARAAALYDAEAGPVPEFPPAGPFAAWDAGRGGRGWAAADGHLVARPGAGSIRLACPLEGDFEFAFEIDGRATVSYGGHEFTAGTPIRRQREDDGGAYQPAGSFMPYVLRVKGGRVSLRVGGVGASGATGDQPVRATKPFLAIAPVPDTEPLVLRNLALTGSPRVPREVALVGPSEADWTSTRVLATRSFSPSRSSPLSRKPNPTWGVKDGVLTGRRVADTRAAPTYYAYGRLTDGEEFAYEFFHAPGSAGCAPAVGDLAFVLTPGGVRLHWRQTATGDAASARLRAAPATHRRGPAKLPLKANDWNAVRVAVRGRAVTVALNGEVVYEHPLDAGYDPDVGLFYQAHREEARVRSAVLRGVWGAAPPADLAAARVPTDRLARAWAGEDLLAENAAAVIDRARGLPPAERYEVLRAWVLPTATRPGYRLRGEPTKGGELVVPATELVAAAAAAGRLGELAAPGGPAGWAALLAMAAGRDADAVAALDGIKFEGRGVTADDLWAAFLAAREGAARPGTRDAAARLFDRLAALFPRPRFPLAYHIHAARAAAAGLGKGVPLGPDVVSGGGGGAAKWVFDGDTLRALPGVPTSVAYAPAPLVGDFEAEFELEFGDGKAPIGVTYAGVGLRVAADGKGATKVGGRFGSLTGSLMGFSPFGNRDAATIAVDPPLAGAGGRLPGAVRVRGGRLVIAFAGRTLLDEPVAAAANPWLAFTPADGRPGGARLVRVTAGPPPASVALFAEAEEDGGLPSSGRYASWFPLTDRVFFRTMFSTPARRTYPRPLPQAATVEYEFFYEPGRSAAWPVVGGETITPADRAGLTANAWNRVVLDVKGDRVAASFNGRPAPPRTLDPANGRTVGIVQADDAACGAVRGARLSSDWPALAQPRDWLAAMVANPAPSNGR